MRRAALARRARIVIAGYTMWVIVRGIDRAALFVSAADRQSFLGSLGEGAAAEAVSEHADVLMTNQAICSSPRQASGGRAGTLFEGRFRGSLFEGDRYRLACPGSLELNPVRAGLLEDPGANPWANDRANALGAPQPVLTRQPLLVGLAETDEACRAAYRDLFAEAIAQDLLAEVRRETNGGFALGGERFQREIAVMLGRPEWRDRLSRSKKPGPHAGQIELPV